MAPHDIVAELRRMPFSPFELFAVDGPSYRVDHPDLCMVLMTAVIVGVANANQPESLENHVKIDNRLISRIQPILRETIPAKPQDPPTLNA
jgi:hypothetical protein